MDVVIFCGGRGTRLSEKTKETPKPLVEVGDYPILWHIMKLFSHYGHDRFMLTLGYKGDLIKQWFLNYRFNGSFEFNLKEPVLPDHPEAWKILFKNTGMDSGTGGRLKQVKDDIKSERFIVTYGDGVADVDIDSLIAHHKKMVAEKGVLVTVSAFRPNSSYGVIKHDGAGIVTSFGEKCQVNDMINIGFMVCERGVFEHIPDNLACMFEKEVLSKLTDQGKVAIYEHQGVFHSMDTYKDYTDLNALWNSGDAKWKAWKD
ncbi:sugar phosphate nucleotidyltransferase [Nanoarchaeota archaeon]